LLSCARRAKEQGRGNFPERVAATAAEPQQEGTLDIDVVSFGQKIEDSIRRTREWGRDGHDLLGGAALTCSFPPLRFERRLQKTALRIRLDLDLLKPTTTPARKGQHLPLHRPTYRSSGPR
jgi:hypothetical protein